MSVTVGILGIIIGIVLLNYFVYKGVNVVLASTLVSLLIIVSSGLPLSETWNTAMSQLGEMLSVLGPVIMFGAVLGVLYTKSGAAASLGDAFMRPFKNAANEKVRIIGCLSMFLTVRILIGLAGIDNMAIMYTMLAICAGMLADIHAPRKYINALLMIAGTCGTLVPGAPNSMLLTLEQYIPGFDNSKALLLRALLLLLYVIVCVFILYKLIKRDIDAGMGYEPGPLSFPDAEGQKRPHVLLTLLPLIAVYVFYNVIHIDAWASLLIGIAVAVVCFGPHLPKEDGKSRLASVVDTAGSGVFLVPLGILFSFLPGFIMASSPAYGELMNGLCSIPVPGVFGLLIAAILLTGLAGLSGVVLAAPICISVFIPGGLSPQACGLIVLFAGTVLDTLPNSLGIITQCEILDCTMKECYPSILWTTVLATLGIAVLMAVCAMAGIV